MRQRFRRPAGFGLALLLAGLTFAVVVLSGLFLVYQSGANPQPGFFELPFGPAAAQLHEAKIPHPDHSRATAQRLARGQRIHHHTHA